MTKDEYLSILQNNLRNMPAEEVQNIIRYYREYFEDAGEENTEKVMEELGTPESLAQKASYENEDTDFFQNKYAQSDSQYQYAKGNMRGGMQKEKSGVGKVLLIVLVVIGSPVWLAFAIAALAVLFGVMVAVVSVLFAFVVTCVALIASGIFAMGVGFVGMFTHVPTGLLTMGMGLVCIGIGILLLIGSVALMKLTKKGFLWVKDRIMRRGNTNEKDS